MELKESVLGKLNESFSLRDGVLKYQERLCVPNVDGGTRSLRKLIGPVIQFILVKLSCIMTLGKYFGGMV